MLNEIFYSECLICTKKINFKNVICDVCFNNLKRIDYFCQLCGYPLEQTTVICRNCFQKRYYDKMFVLYWYNYEMKTLLKYYKFHYGVKELSLFNRLLSGFCLGDSYDLVTPVPVFFLRKFARFVQPAYFLSKIISENFKICYDKVLKRIRHTEYQWKLKRSLRLQNIKGAFECIKGVKDLKILLVDDITTSGATINECARVLKISGARKVDVFCLTKGMFL